MATEELREQEEGLDLEKYGLLFLSHWHWFVASVVLALGLAVFHIMRTTPIYTRTTQLLVKDDEGGTNGALQEFKELGLLSSASNISNEILTISAPILMDEVTKRLGLDWGMSVKSGLHMRPLYNDAPVRIGMNSEISDESSFSFVMKLKGENQVELSDFSYRGEVIEKTIVAVADSSVVKTPVGDLVFEKLPSWDNESLAGEEIRVVKYPVRTIGSIYSARLSVSLSEKESTVLNLTLSDEVPARAEDVLLALIDVYNENWVKDKNRVADDTDKFISKRLETLTKELSDVDETISDYKSTNLLPDVKASVAQDMQQSSHNYQRLLDLNNQLSMTGFVREHLADPSNAHELLPSNTGLPSSGVESMITAYNKLMLERSTIVENSSEQTAYVMDIDRKLASQKTAILRSLDNLLAQLKQQIANIEKSERDINRQIASNPRQVLELQSVERQQKVKEALYIFLLQKREENELTKTYTAWNTSVIQPPIGSLSPSAPRRSMILLVAFVLGLVVPGGILFLRESMNHAVRGRKDLEGLKIPFLGEIPSTEGKRHWWQRKRKQAREIVVKEGSKNIINESFRLVRTKLDYFMGKNHDLKVIMVTSFNPGSGKTFISANLAKTFAIRGKRVVCLDLDLRHHSLSSMIGKNKNGLSSYLNDLVEDYHQILVKDGLSEGVDIIPVGIIPPNPTELLMSPRMQELVEQLRNEYDYVFLDCPPVEIVADAFIVKDLVDVSLFVVRAGLMDRRVLPMVDELYSEDKYNRLAILLNGTTHVSGKYGHYRYGYTYGYTNGYAYGYHDNRKS